MEFTTVLFQVLAAHIATDGQISAADAVDIVERMSEVSKGARQYCSVCRAVLARLMKDAARISGTSEAERWFINLMRSNTPTDVLMAVWGQGFVMRKNSAMVAARFCRAEFIEELARRDGNFGDSVDRGVVWATRLNPDSRVRHIVLRLWAENKLVFNTRAR